MTATGTYVVNLRVDDYDIYIGRPSEWGNPYIVGTHGNRRECIAWYREYILSNARLMAKLPELRGKRLGCYCAPAQCHGDVLVELIERLARKENRAAHTIASQ